MVKLPILMPTCLVGEMTNTDSEKKSLFNIEKPYRKNVLENLVKMVSEKEINILDLDQLEGHHLKQKARELGIPTSKKSNIVLLEEIKAVARVFLAGQGKLACSDIGQVPHLAWSQFAVFRGLFNQ